MIDYATRRAVRELSKRLNAMMGVAPDTPIEAAPSPEQIAASRPNAWGPGGPGGDPALDLVWTANGDTDGLFHYLGTNGDTVAFVNPATNGKVIVSALTSYSGALGPENVTDRGAGLYHSAYPGDGPGQWIAWDLGTNRFEPSRYTLRARGDTPAHLPRSWKLQGSDDGAAWTDLDTVTDDARLNAVGVWGAFDVEASGTTYRYLRLLQTGPSSDGLHYLSLGEIELYGTLA